MNSVNLADLLSEENVAILTSSDKDGAIRELAALLVKSGKVNDAGKFVAALFEREEIMSTGIGLEIAIPHVHSPSVEKMSAAVGISKDGIEWESLDGAPAKVIFMIAAPEDVRKHYLKVLARATFVLRHQDFRDALLKAGDAKAIYDLLIKH